MNTYPLIIISGPSGVGEDSVINGLEKQLPIERVITTTTREPRAGEHDGHPYYFISKAAFESYIAAGELFEYAQHYNDNYYGVTRQEIERVKDSGNIGIWKIDYKGVEQAKQEIPGIIAIFINAPLDILEQRIRRRADVSEAYIAERMAYTKEWLKHVDIYDYQVENEEGKLDHTIEEIAGIIRSHSGIDKTDDIR